MGAYEIITAENLSAAELAKRIDHSLLFAYSTKEEILKFCGEVKECGFGCAAINPRFIELVAKELKGTEAHIDAPIGYPWGANLIETKAAEIYSCVRLGATDVDYVKTSTGFGSGWCTVEDVKLLKDTVGVDMGVKASGRVTDYKFAMDLLHVGASRIGTRAGVDVIRSMG